MARRVQKICLVPGRMLTDYFQHLRDRVSPVGKSKPFIIDVDRGNGLTNLSPNHIHPEVVFITDLSDEHGVVAAMYDNFPTSAVELIKSIPKALHWLLSLVVPQCVIKVHGNPARAC